jgi:flavin reductase
MIMALNSLVAPASRTIEAELFREGMARVAAAVHIVTAIDGGAVAGVTATAVCSVSDTPPTLLVCLNRKGRLHAMLQRGSAIAVNTLKAGQEQLAGLFAGQGAVPMDERFNCGIWQQRPNEAPTLLDCVVNFRCRVEDITQAGSHSIVICRVVDVQTGKAPEGLVYGARRYASVSLPGE